VKQPPVLPSGLTLVDSHCHLADAAFAADREETWRRAQAAGVIRLVVIGAGGGSASNREAIELAKTHPDVMRAVVGIHPHDAKDATPPALDEIALLAGDEIVAAIGETGLDYHYKHSTPEQQVESLRAHVRLAHAASKPLVIHCRDAYADLARVLREENAASVGGVIHCFTGSGDEARLALDLGFAISLAGIVTFKNADALRAAARVVPLDRLLVETDSPFLAPVPLRGKRCEPAFVVATAIALAEVRGESLDGLCAATTANALERFAFAPRA
jgi:TatD DNase family protein